MDPKTFRRFAEFTHRVTGITLAPNRLTMLQGRLRPRMMMLKIDDFEAYLDLVERDPQERQEFVNRVTTNETYFFRTPRIWDYIEIEYLPNWYRANPGAVLNAWSAAASSGEEAHSLAIVFEQFREKNPSFRYQILATDISKEVLAKGEKGIYRGRSIETFKCGQAALFKKYMKETAVGEYTVTPHLHSKIRFQHANLFENADQKKSFDLVLVRNVLIYFSAQDQEKVLTRIAAAMKPGSSLIIGESESLNRIKTSFVYRKPLIYELSKAAA